MGPVEARCPRRIISAASPLRDPDPANERNYAAQWRQKCLDQSAATARRKAELVNGAAIRLSCVLDFSDGYNGDYFTVAVIKRRGRNRTYFRSPNGGLYRIRNLDTIGYRMEPGSCSLPASIMMARAITSCAAGSSRSAVAMACSRRSVMLQTIPYTGSICQQKLRWLYGSHGGSCDRHKDFSGAGA
jgi:hypothetical protein